MHGEEMPRIDVGAVEAHDSDEQAILLRIVKGECLRASKPAIRRDTEHERIDRLAAYVWRMAAFFLSPKSRHHCTPVCAEFDLPLEFEEREGEEFGSPERYARLRLAYDHRDDLRAQLDGLVDRIIDVVPAGDWHGVRRWGEAYGMIGTPQVAPDGSIVYR